jgi:hypothetical protein
MELVIGFLIIALGCGIAGVLLIKSCTKPSADPPIASAHIANLEGGDRVRAKAWRTAGKVERIGRPLGIMFGLGLIAAPWVSVYLLFRSLGEGWGTKGRVLRIRNRAQLPEPALGEGWAGDEIVLRGSASARERRVLGELWLLTARMEHASIAAFSQLGIHLCALGAPARLLEATHRAALDEIRHARACFAVVHALTGVRQTAGPILALATSDPQPIDLIRLAIGSLVDGCVGEGIAADVASRGGELAEEPAIRQVLAMIAEDEARHAELAWDVLAWCLFEGGPAVERVVRARVAVLDRELDPRLPDIPGMDAAMLARHGVIDQDALGKLASARIAAVRERAHALVGKDAPAMAA